VKSRAELALQQREVLLRAFDQAIARCQAGHVLAEYLPPAPEHGRLIVLGAGKAAGRMAEAAERHYASSMTEGRMTGLVVVPVGTDTTLQTLETMHAPHPLPDERSETAAEAMLSLVTALNQEDRVLVLLSGGASSLLCAPIAGITLAEKRALTKDLLASGASIEEINTVRIGLSDIKGGGLARACWPATVTTLAVSDVVGDRPEVIGSGPTVDVTVPSQALINIAHKYEIPLPGNTADLVAASAQARSGNFPTSHYEVVVRPRDALAAAATMARQYGYESIILGDAIEGEARNVAATIAAECDKPEYKGRKVALLSGGEVTVTIEPTAGEYYGGSNREFALALALELPDSPPVTALIADTDGADGQPGANGPVAGAVVDSSTVARAKALDLDAKDFLERHDSGSFFARLGDEVVCGPTGTNVNDFRMILIN
jgi:hydroxypyruvate reductase